MVKLSSLIILLLIGISTKKFKNETDCTLSVELSNFRNNKGKLYIFIYNYKNQFPDNPYKYFEVDKFNVRNSRMLVNLPKIPKGKYAISILDDENSNEDLDRFLGIPTEGYGFSNNIRPLFSLPDYEDLVFDLNMKHQKLNLKLQYTL